MASINLHLIMPDDKPAADIILGFVQGGYSVQMQQGTPLFLRSPTTSIVNFCLRLDKSMSGDDARRFSDTLTKTLLKDVLYLAAVYSIPGTEHMMVFLPANIPAGREAEAQAVTNTAYDAIQRV